ncbi:MAG TPA: DNA alkylation repair protein [Nitrospirota bacterium]
MTAEVISARLRSFAAREKAKLLQGFFKTGPGQYGEGDIFIGVMVPNIRRVAKEFQSAPITQIIKLLKSPIHEERLLSLLMLVQAYEKTNEAVRKTIYGLYLRNTRFINNWDLVDLSAPNIVGVHLVDKSRKPLYALAKSRDLWKRRIAILATFAFIKRNDHKDSLKIGSMLLKDEHDLIHKAVGWMLREIGKRDLAALEGFLKKYYHDMPRTMLRYAIERFPEGKRRRYLEGKA